MATSAELLVLVEAAIETRLSGGAVQSYSIRGRQLQYMSLQELRNFRDQLRREVSAEGHGLPLGYGIATRTEGPA